MGMTSSRRVTVAPGLPRARRRRARPLAVKALAVALASGVLTVALAVTTTDASDAATKPSYCALARTFDGYRGGRPATVRALLSRALQVAPTDIASTIRTMRNVPEPSPRFDAAKAAWTRYNTNNCCTCLGGPNAPRILAAPEP